MQNDARVAPSTRTRVLEAIEELGYVPALSAQLMRAEPEPTIGLFVSSVDIPIFGQLNRYLHEELTALGYHVLQETIVSSTRSEQESAMENLVRMPIKGMLVSVGGVEKELHHKFAERVPLLVVGRPEPTHTLHTVGYDEDYHGEILVNHLAELGHRKIMMQDALMNRTMGTWVRVQAQKRRAAELGIEFDATYTSSMNDQQLEQWLLQTVEDGYTAIMTVFDRRLVQLLQASRRVGIRVPEDISMTGSDGVMDGVDLLGFTTVKKPVELVGRSAARRIVELVEEGEPAAVINEKYRGDLIVGTTAGRP